MSNQYSFISKYEPWPCVPPCAPVCGAADSLHPLVALPVAAIRFNTELRPGPSKQCHIIPATWTLGYGV